MPAGRAGKIKIKQPLDLKFTQNIHKMLLLRFFSGTKLHHTVLSP